MNCLSIVYKRNSNLLKNVINARHNNHNDTKIDESGNKKEKLASNWGSNKLHRDVKLNIYTGIVDSQTAKVLAPFQLLVKEQGNYVRKLKEDGANEADVKSAINELKTRKKVLENKQFELAPNAITFDRAKMEILAKRRFFYDQSFEMYGSCSGLFDYGPMGCALKNNLLSAWRRFFVLEEQMLEVDCPILTPEPVFKASGHLDRFADYLVKDMQSGECFRLDHLLNNALERLCSRADTSSELKTECTEIINKLKGNTKDEMAALLKRFSVKSPTTGNDLSGPIEFNLMFGTQIGPAGLVKGFLRPETAQGIFVNFKRLLDFNQGVLPFSAAQIGNAFRNEISPRSGLLRVREFTMAEIEHFCDPNEKSHAKFNKIQNTEILLYSARDQLDGKIGTPMKIGDAVKSGLVANETLGYFMARIQQYLLKVGILPERLRFRQHMSNEIAHYASDCWDAECLTSYGWIECVGCADRSAFDLTQHSKATGIKLVAKRKLSTPKQIDVTELKATKLLFGKLSKRNAKLVCKKLEEIDHIQQAELLQTLSANGYYEMMLKDDITATLDNSMVEVKITKKTEQLEEITPSVVEPSFGIGRILYVLLEHRFRIRDDGDQLSYFALPAFIAPLKCAVLPLSSKPEFAPFVQQISSQLTLNDISHKVDDVSGSIGRRYVRSDEIGIPFGVTIDFDTLNQPHTVTLRERDSKDQLRLPIEDVSDVIQQLSSDKVQWTDLITKYPKFDKQESIK